MQISVLHTAPLAIPLPFFRREMPCVNHNQDSKRFQSDMSSAAVNGFFL
jgi:hypothetical protein